MSDEPKLSKEMVRRAVKLLRDCQPVYGQTIHWVNNNGSHSKFWGHRARIQFNQWPIFVNIEKGRRPGSDMSGLW